MNQNQQKNMTKENDSKTLKYFMIITSQIVLGIWIAAFVYSMPMASKIIKSPQVVSSIDFIIFYAGIMFLIVWILLTLTIIYNYFGLSNIKKWIEEFVNESQPNYKYKKQTKNEANASMNMMLQRNNYPAMAMNLDQNFFQATNQNISTQQNDLYMNNTPMYSNQNISQQYNEMYQNQVDRSQFNNFPQRPVVNQAHNQNYYRYGNMPQRPHMPQNPNMKNNNIYNN